MIDGLLRGHDQDDFSGVGRKGAENENDESESQNILRCKHANEEFATQKKRVKRDKRLQDHEPSNLPSTAMVARVTSNEENTT